MEGEMATVLVAFGTRPEAVKMAPVVAALRSRPSLQTVVCTTGQHRELLRQVLSLFRVGVDRDLALMEDDQELADLTARTLSCLARVIGEVRPDLVLVQGDTSSAMATSLAAFFAQVPVGHVEAGLRTSSVAVPFPEELNRRMIGQIAALHFAPTAGAEAALLREGVPQCRVFVTGNTIVDALHWVARQESPNTPLGELADKRIIVVTAHRRESFGPGFERICRALLEVVERHADLAIVYPVHPNPNVRGPVEGLLGRHPRIRLVEPLDYRDFVNLLARSYLVLTDSGGVQEEAPVLGKPVLVMRDETERQEGIEAGVARLVGTDSAAIVGAVESLLHDERRYARMARAGSLYGDGHAAERIADRVEQFLAARSGRVAQRGPTSSPPLD
jgi:UDP-N-acetylglucosamine 2-epimerase (non-hydrolysing)